MDSIYLATYLKDDYRKVIEIQEQTARIQMLRELAGALKDTIGCNNAEYTAVMKALKQIAKEIASEEQG